jgi:hypothetical protein
MGALCLVGDEGLDFAHKRKRLLLANPLRG